MDKNNDTKLYWSTKELAEHLGEPIHTVRYWEREFSSFLKPRTTISGRYQYSREDLKTAALIKHLLREKHYTIAGAKDYLRNRKSGNMDKKDIIDTLLEVKDKLYKIRAELNAIKDNG